MTDELESTESRTSEPERNLLISLGSISIDGEIAQQVTLGAEGDKSILAKDKDIQYPDVVDISPISTPLNDKLPPEVLECIFLEYVFCHGGPGDSARDLGPVLPVCRSWYTAASRLEFVLLELLSHSTIDDLLARVEDRERNGLVPRAKPLYVTIAAEGRADLCRFEEIFNWIHSSVKTLILRRNNLVSGQGTIIETFERTQNSYPLFSYLQELSITEFRWNEVSALLLACNPLYLRALTLSHGLADMKLIQTLHLPNLRYFEIKSETYVWRNDQESPMQENWRLFIRGSPVLECIAICIRQDTLPWLVEILRTKVPSSVRKLKVFATPTQYGSSPLGPEDPSLKDVIQFARGRSWEIWLLTPLERDHSEYVKVEP